MKNMKNEYRCEQVTTYYKYWFAINHFASVRMKPSHFTMQLCAIDKADWVKCKIYTSIDLLNFALWLSSNAKSINQPRQINTKYEFNEKLTNNISKYMQEKLIVFQVPNFNWSTLISMQIITRKNEFSPVLF